MEDANKFLSWILVVLRLGSSIVLAFLIVTPFLAILVNEPMKSQALIAQAALGAACTGVMAVSHWMLRDFDDESTSSQASPQPEDPDKT